MLFWIIFDIDRVGGHEGFRCGRLFQQRFELVAIASASDTNPYFLYVPFIRIRIHQEFSRVSIKKRKQMDLNKLRPETKLVRTELDLTQTQLAQRINSKQKSIFRYETGASLPSIRTLVKIAKVLKKPAGYFLED